MICVNRNTAANKCCTVIPQINHNHVEKSEIHRQASQKFSKEVWEQEIVEVIKQLRWAQKNMMECEYGTQNCKTWIELVIHLSLQITEMRNCAEYAIREL